VFLGHKKMTSATQKMHPHQNSDMKMMLLMPLSQTGRSMSANTIGQSKVTINLYCWQWQRLKE
jgi:hypothetical protein